MEKSSQQAEALEQADASTLQSGNEIASAATTAQPHRSVITPILSGIVFGTIGAFIGRTIGKKGDNNDRKLAQNFMTWFLGGLFGLIASYSAFRSQPEIQKIPVRSIEPVANETVPYANVGNAIPIATPPAGKPLPPQPSLQADSVQRDGLLDKNAGQQLA